MKQYVCLSAERIDAERKKILITIKSRIEMKKNILKVAFVVAIALVSGINMFNSHKTETLSDIVLANVEALALDNEIGGSVHELTCGQSGLKMCEAECGRCVVKLKAWGNGGSAKLYCPL